MPTRSPGSGLVEPQIKRVPPYVESVGLEAIEHYESLNEIVELDWWQRDFIMDALGVRRDGSWAAFEAALAVQRQNGKGQPTDVIELAGLFLFGEELISHSAHQMKTSREAFTRVSKIIKGTASLSRQVRRVMRSKGEEGFELMDGRRLMFFSRSDGSGRGFTGNRVVLDEAQVLDGERMADIVPTMAATIDAQVIYTYTPPRGSGSHVAALRRRAKAGTDNRTVYYGWENPRGTSLDDPDALARANPAYPHRITAERMADMRRTINDDELFARECIGIWPRDEKDGWLVIGSESWNDCRDATSVPRNPVALAADVLPDRQAGAIGAAGHRDDGLLHAELTGQLGGLVDYRPGVDVGWMVPRLVEIVAGLGDNRPCVIVVNDRVLADAAEAAGLTVYRPQTREVAAWCGAFFDAVEAGRLRHPDQPDLNDAVRDAVKRSVGQVWAWQQNCVLTAVSLALGGLQTPRIHQVTRAPVSAFVAQGGRARRKSEYDDQGNRVIRMGGGDVDNDRGD